MEYFVIAISGDCSRSFGPFDNEHLAIAQAKVIMLTEKIWDGNRSEHRSAERVAVAGTVAEAIMNVEVKVFGNAGQFPDAVLQGA